MPCGIFSFVYFLKAIEKLCGCTKKSNYGTKDIAPGIFMSWSGNNSKPSNLQEEKMEAARAHSTCISTSSTTGEKYGRGRSGSQSLLLCISSPFLFAFHSKAFLPPTISPSRSFSLLRNSVLLTPYPSFRDSFFSGLFNSSKLYGRRNWKRQCFF